MAGVTRRMNDDALRASEGIKRAVGGENSGGDEHRTLREEELGHF